ncbi:hypothetical protein L604_004400000070 [Bacillus subtilis J27]|nr:hypothetical protein L604_004400000070 [Bacillus subtilis J27]
MKKAELEALIKTAVDQQVKGGAYCSPQFKNKTPCHEVWRWIE